MRLSISEAINQAFTRAVLVTFQPFDLGKWFVLGFVAFLASLGQNFAAPHSFRLNFRDGFHFPPLGPHLVIIAIIITIAVIVGLALGLLITWIKSRAVFMFIDGVVRNSSTDLVVRPWTEFRPQGNSLFGFTLVYSFIGMAIFALIAGVCILIALPDIQAQDASIHTFRAIVNGECRLAYSAQDASIHTVLAILIGGLLFIPLWLALIVVYLCTFNFVVPIMYLRRQGVLAAWREFRTVIVPGHVGSLLLFFLTQLAIYIAIGVLVLIVGGFSFCFCCIGFLPCCCLCCIGALPYLSTVLTLPVHVFHLCFPLCFLQQFGPDYQFFTAATTATQPPPAPPPPDYEPFPPNP